MNQCSRNSSRNAAVLLGQLVERRDGGRIAQHHGDLPALCAQRSLTLGAGLDFTHSLICRITSCRNGRFGLPVTAATIRSISGRSSACTAASNLATHSAAMILVFSSSMGVLRSGQIQPDYGSVKKLFVNSPLVELLLKHRQTAVHCGVAKDRQHKPAVDSPLDVAVVVVDEARNFAHIASLVQEPLWRDAGTRVGEVVGFLACGLELLKGHGRHFRLRSGPIPPMNESYAVTSDVSTTFDIAPQQAFK